MPEELQPQGTVLRMVPKTAAAEPKVEESADDDSPEALLLNLLEKVRSGWRPHMLVVHAVYDDAQRPGMARHIFWSHHVANSLEHLGLLDLAKYSLLTEPQP